MGNGAKGAENRGRGVVCSEKAHKYVGIETLDPYALRELVPSIYVEAPDKSSAKRRQSIHSKYDGLGFIPLDELMKGETA